MQKKHLTKHNIKIGTVNKVDLEGTYLNIIKAKYEKPVINITLSREKLIAFLLKPDTRQVSID